MQVHLLQDHAGDSMLSHCRKDLCGREKNNPARKQQQDRISARHRFLTVIVLAHILSFTSHWEGLMLPTHSSLCFGVGCPCTHPETKKIK
jgi:hypothetical protein